MNASEPHDLWARVMFHEVLKIARAEGKCDLKTSKHHEHKSRNARESSCDFLFIIFSTIVFRHEVLTTFYRALQFSG